MRDEEAKHSIMDEQLIVQETQLILLLIVSNCNIVSVNAILKE